MKKIISGLTALPLITFLSCGEVGDADIGATVVVTASADKSFVQQDIISNTDGSCTYTSSNVIYPPPENVNITINVQPISTNIANPSPVSITSIEYRYIPASSIFPSVSRAPLWLTTTVQPNNSATISVPVASTTQIEGFATDYMNLINVNYEYNLELKIKMKEINYNKDLEKQVRLNVVFQNVKTDTECSQTQ